MRYGEKEARELVLHACHELVRTRLVARTWGNVSARISDTQFVITPSGRDYDTLDPGDLVVINISDCSYEGDIKPSVEKGIHADIYALRDEVNFVIHTHQHYASAICAECEDTEFAPCAGYGFSGSEKLRGAVRKTAEAFPDKNMFLMAKHGVLCCGDTYESAFEAAVDLEKKCEELFRKKAVTPSHKAETTPWLDDYAQMFGMWNKPVEDDEEVLKLIRAKNHDAAAYVKHTRPMGLMDVMLQHYAFKHKYSKLKGSKSEV